MLSPCPGEPQPGPLVTAHGCTPETGAQAARWTSYFNQVSHLKKLAFGLCKAFHGLYYTEPELEFHPTWKPSLT